MAYPTQGIVANALPGTGVFGFGQVQVFGVSGTFVVPAGVNNVRVRLWAAGGGSGGGGGGFAMRTIYNLAGLGLTSVAVTVPTASGSSSAGGTVSFGTLVSATGGSSGSSDNFGGTGVGGDINTTGGRGTSSGGGGGVASMWGNGGNGTNPPTSAASGGGSSSSSTSGGSGLTGAGGVWNGGTNAPASPQTNLFGSIDFIGTGGGGGFQMSGVNGGGGGMNMPGGFPGGGGGQSNPGAAGLVIVEY